MRSSCSARALRLAPGCPERLLRPRSEEGRASAPHRQPVSPLPAPPGCSSQLLSFRPLPCRAEQGAVTSTRAPSLTVDTVAAGLRVSWGCGGRAGGGRGQGRPGVAAKRGAACSDSPLSPPAPLCFVFLFLAPFESLAHLISSPLSFFVSTPLSLNLLLSEEKWLNLVNQRPNTPKGRTYEKGGRLPPLGSSSAAQRVPVERKGWEGMGVAEKNQCKACHFPGLVTGAGGLRRAGKPRRARHWLQPRLDN